MADKIRTVKLENEIGIKVFEGTRSGGISIHAHEFTELVLILGGSGVHLTAGGAAKVRPGDVYVLKKNEPHGYSDMKNMSLITITIGLERLPFAMDTLRLIPGYNNLFEVEATLLRRRVRVGYLNISPDEMTLAGKKAYRLRDEIEKGSPGFELLAAACLLDLIVFLVRLYDKRGAEKKPDITALRMGTVLSYIEKHCAEDIDLPKLARTASLSVPHFIRLFKTVTGATPMQYVMSRRIISAERIFRQTNANISEAAAACGFTDTNHFARMFRQYKGMSPRQYRNLFRAC